MSSAAFPTIFPEAPPEAAAPPIAKARRRAGLLCWLPLLLVGVCYVGASLGPAVFNENEAQYAGAAREMLNRPQDYQLSARRQSERGQFLIPTNDGIPRLQKPPFVYWTLIASMRLFGINDFGARLPNALASLAWFAGIMMIGRRLTRDPAEGLRLGVAAATILATMAGTFIFSHLIAPEPFLAAFLAWTFWCLLSACRRPEHADRFVRLAWLLMALGALSKGVHAVFYPLAVAGILAWRHPGTRPVWRRLFHPAGWLLFAAVWAPWHVYVEYKYPGFLRDHFFNEQLGHVLNRRYPADNSTVPWPTFAVEHLVLFLPWTFFIPAAWSMTVRVETHERDTLGRDLLVAWFGITLASILFSSLQDYYLLTAFGPVAFWIARPWVARARNPGDVPQWTLVAPGVALGALGLGILGVGVYLRLRGIDLGLATNADSERDQIWATISGFSVAAWARLLPLFWGTGFAFLLAGMAGIFLARRGQRPLVLVSTAVMMVAVLAMATRGMCVLEDYFSLKKMALVMNQVVPPAAKVVCFGPTTNSPSLLFYLDREVYWLGASPDGEFASRELGINRNLFLSEEDFSRQWAGTAPLFLCIEGDDLQKLSARMNFAAAPTRPVLRCGTMLLLRNRAAASVAR